MLKRFVVYIIAILTITAVVTQPAVAIQSPAGCNSNRLNLTITRDKILVSQGETLTYTVTVSNVDSGSALACDIDTAAVTVTLPGMDGSPTGTVVQLATNASYPAGTPVTLVGTVPYIVNVNPGVIDATAQAEVHGVLHDAPTDHAADIVKTIGTSIISPTTPTPDDPSLPGLPNTATAFTS